MRVSVSLVLRHPERSVLLTALGQFIYCMKPAVGRRMSRTTAGIPDDLTDLTEGAVKVGIFENKSDAIRHVLHEYLCYERQALNGDR